MTSFRTVCANGHLPVAQWMARMVEEEEGIHLRGGDSVVLYGLLDVCKNQHFELAR